jgi:hypothetical protein
MPRKQRIRHFEPRYDINREMVDIEAGYVACEHQDYLTLSLNDMRQKLHELRGKWGQADQTAEALIRCLPEREALAFQCLMIRDLFLVLELYNSCLQTARESDPSQPVIPASTPRSPPAEKILPFSEWLFEPTR